MLKQTEGQWVLGGTSTKQQLSFIMEKEQKVKKSSQLAAEEKVQSQLLTIGWTLLVESMQFIT